MKSNCHSRESGNPAPVEHLLTHFDRISDAPDAIPRLRRFILDLAVRGKLVPQHPTDESVATRYASQPVSDELPGNWRLLNFGKFCDIEGGNQPPKSQFINEPRDGYVQLLQIRDFGQRPVPTYIPNNSTNRFCKEGEILIGRYGASIGKIFWAKNGAYNVAIAKFIWPEDAFIPAFAFLILKSRCFQGPLTKATRSAQAGFNKRDLATLNFPLPPLAEQHRIVAKVDELITLCDNLEAARLKREATRDRTATASLARLNTPDPDPTIFQNHAAFALNNLTPLTTHPDQIKVLRQTILNLAVRGKLVPQDPSDEPASELLKRIAKDFSRQVAEGKLNKPKPVKPLSAKEGLFPLPQGWAVARFNQVAAIQSNLVDPKRYTALPHIAPDNIESWTARLLSYVSVAEAGVYSGKHLFAAGAILYSKIRPNLAKVAKVDFDGLCSADMYPIHTLIDRDFLVKFMITKDFVAQAVKEENRVAMPKINQSALSDIVVVVPPLAEQHRIVAKIDELMAFCDRLEASLVMGDEIQARLVEVLLHEALVLNTPVPARR